MSRKRVKIKKTKIERGKHELDNNKDKLARLLKQYTRAECCKILHISPGTLYNYFREFPRCEPLIN